MRALVLLLLLPSLALGQTAVKVYPVDTTQTGCVLNALNTTCQIALAGKSSAGFVVTAVSSPSGISLVTESSRDGTNWDGHKFVDTDDGDTLTTVPNASLAVGYTKGMLLGAGARHVRVRVSAYTSGSVTVAVTGSDTIYSSNFPTHEVNDGSAQPTTQTTGEFRSMTIAPDGIPFERHGGPVTWACSLNGIAATLTECKAAAPSGLRNYITWIWWQSTTTTAGTGAIQYGTGTNCGTGTTALLPASGTANRYGYPASSASGGAGFFTFLVPLKPAAATAICAIGVATNTLRIDMGGFVAP